MRARDDDGATIADMSMVDRRVPAERAPRPAADELSDPESRRAAILGTLKAALSIGMVYIVIFGIVIALLVFLWN